MKILERLFNSKKERSKKIDLGRNDICWCGSGKKYKRCHLDKDAYQKRMQDDLGRTIKK